MIKIEALFIAIYLFFAGFIYGDEPVKLEFTYDIPSEIYIYEPGDAVEINLTVKNVGRPFKESTYFSNLLSIKVFNPEDNTDIYNEDAVILPDETLWLFNHNEVKTFKVVCFISDDSTKGMYDLTVNYKTEETFKNVFEVK